MKNVLIAGGGLAGLVSACLLSKRGIAVTLIERKSYPFHRVCGEYISNETLSFLHHNNLLPDLTLPRINRLQLTSVNGKSAIFPLDLGGFGISRYTFDHFLYKEALAAGAHVLQNTEVEDISYDDDGFTVKTLNQDYRADVVLGAFGKRSRLDLKLDRSFIKSRSPYAAVKYHIKTIHPPDLIALHNFKNGYCGISAVDGEKQTLCYLTHRHNLKHHGNLRAMEQAVLFSNPFLKTIFQNAEFLYAKPEVINEISFAKKTPVTQHILMAGDAAGMITPLCGNGMAMALHAAKIASDLITEFCESRINRAHLENEYARKWNTLFARRLWAGRQIQKLFGAEWTSNLAVGLVKHVKPVAGWLVKQTHGVPF
ncbi:MAG: NAD(P)/FAD-dependent oxidoreductase [Cyclobacteriaceae bacterium]|nr:NAD(P)/FAD-dependent oxidoreductase [Cyclobacteriaceae bacterium]